MATKYTRNERIAIMVIEDQIYDYYHSIIDRLIAAKDGAWFSDIDSDDIKAVKVRANEVFKSITDVDIYTALSEAFDYEKTTIINKIAKHTKRIETWNYFMIDPDTVYFNGKELADICYVKQVTNYSAKDRAYTTIIKGIARRHIDNAILSEDDIYEIKDIINKRSDAIYDGNPDSKVAPALTKFERYMIDYEKEEEKPEETDIPEKNNDVFVISKDATLRSFIDAFGRNHMEYTEIGFHHKGHKWKVIFFCEE